MLPAGRQERAADSDARRSSSDQANDAEDAGARAHDCDLTSGGARSAGRIRIAIFLKPMPSYRELLQQVKSEIREVDAAEAARLLDSDDAPLLLVVRERDEWDDGHIPGALHIPRGSLESRVESSAPDRDRPV